jgi:peroxiredoxin
MRNSQDIVRQTGRNALVGLLLATAVFLIMRQVVGVDDSSRVPDHVLYWGELARRGELKVGDNAPDFRLTSSTGEKQIQLRSLRGRPAVLVFGSYTCPCFRAQVDAINDLHTYYEGEVRFLFVYIREAHPVEDGSIPENDGIAPVHAATCLQDRQRAALACAAALQIQMPILVDDQDNRVATEYRAWPERVYVVDGTGRIAYTNVTPGTIDCRAIADSLQSLLGDCRVRL